jgi:hypothetical protein
LEAYTNSGSPWRSVCLTCDNEVSPQLSSIRYGNGACRHCAHKGPRGSRVDTEVARHEFAEAGVEMIGNFDGVATPTLCRCLKCGNEVPPRLNSLRNGNGACLICSGKAPVDAEVAREEFAEAGVEMIGEFKGTMKPTLCRCNNGPLRTLVPIGQRKSAGRSRLSVRDRSGRIEHAENQETSGPDADRSVRLVQDNKCDER